MIRHYDFPTTSTSRDEEIKVESSIPDSYSSSELNDVSYQLKLLILFLIKGIKCGYDFRLAVEMDVAEKLYDLVFRKLESGKYSYFFLQAKHKLDEHFLIKCNDLKGIDGDFSLRKYFKSYCNTREKSEFKPGELRHFVLATNINLHSNELQDNDGIRLIKVHKFDEFNELLAMKNAICYKVAIHTNSKLFKEFQSSYDLEALANALVCCIKDNELLTLKNEIIKAYHEILIHENIIKIDCVENKRVGKFNENFIKNHELTEEARALKMFIEEKKIEITDNVTLKISSKFGQRGEDDDTLGPVSKLKRLSLPLSTEINPKLVHEFLNDFVFIVNTPNDLDLVYLLRDEIGVEFNLKSSDFIVDEIQKEIFDWSNRNRGKGTFFSSNDGKELFERIRQKVSQLLLVTYTEQYISDLRSFENLFENNIVENLLSILNENCLQNIHSSILKFTTENTTLSAIKIWQALLSSELYRQEDSYIFIQMASLEMSQEGVSRPNIINLRNRISEALKLRNSNLLIVECKGDSLSEDDVHNAVTFLLNDLCLEKPKNKIIFVLKKNSREESILDETYKGCWMRTHRDNANEFSNLSKKLQKSLRNDTKVLLQEEDYASKDFCTSKDILDDESFEWFTSLLTPDDLLNLLYTKTIKIGRKVSKHSGYNKDVYIPRRFIICPRINRELVMNLEFETASHYTKNLFVLMSLENASNNLISPEIFSKNRFRFYAEKDPGPSVPIRFIVVDYFRQHEQVESLREEFNSYNIHLYYFDEYFNFFHKKTYHSKKNYDEREEIARPFGTEKHYLNPSEITLCEKAEKLLLISANPGMGKSTTLSNLAEILPKTSQHPMWILRFDLIKHTRQLHDEEKLKNEEHALHFLIQKFIEPNDELRFKSDFEEKLFRKSVTKNSKIKIILIFDGFDEIGPDYQSVLINLIKLLSASCIYKIIITTRPNMSEFIEKELGVLAYTLADFTEDDQINFLLKYRLKLVDLSKSEREYKEYAKSLIRDLNKKIHKGFDKATLRSISNPDKNINTFDRKEQITAFHRSIAISDRNVNGVPLHLRLFADYISKFVTKENEMPKLPEHFDLLDLCDSFVEIDFCKTSNNKLVNKDYEDYLEKNSWLALDSLLATDCMVSVDNKFTISQLSLSMLSNSVNIKEFLLKDKELELIKWKEEIINENKGIIDNVVNGKVIFTHHTFVDYFAAIGFARRIFSKESFCLIIEYIAGNTLRNFPMSSIFMTNFIRQLKGGILRKFTDEELNFIFWYIHEVNERLPTILEVEEDILPVALEAIMKFSDIPKIGQLLYDLLVSARLRTFYNIMNNLENVKKEVLLKTPIKSPNHGAATLFDIVSKSRILEEGESLEISKYLIENDGGVTFQEYLGHTNFIITGVCTAITKGHKNTFKYFIDKINATTELIVQLANHAITCGQFEMTDFLLNKWKKSNSKGSDEAFYKERKREFLKLFKVLHEQGHSHRYQNPLHLAIHKDCSINTITDLLHIEGVRLYSKCNSQSVLYIAVENPNLELMEYLLNKDVDENAATKDETKDLQTSLQLNISKEGPMEIIMLLLRRRRLHLNEKYSEGALSKVLEIGNIDLLKYVLQTDDNVFQKFQTPLHFAIDINCSMEIIELLLQIDGIDLNAKDEYGQTILIKSIEKSNVQLVERFLEKGVDVNVANWDMSTPLHVAIYKNCSLKILSILLRIEGINFYAEDFNGKTALLLAVEIGNFKFIQRILEKDVYVNDEQNNPHFQIAKKNYITALRKAVEIANEELIECLLENDSIKSAENELPKLLRELLPLAIERECVIVLFKHLLRGQQIDLNAKDKNGRTYLHRAVESGDLKLVKYLLLTIVSVNARTNDLQTPLHLAINEHCSLDIIKVLLEHRATKLHAEDKNGRTALHMAVKLGNVKLVEYLLEKDANVNAVDELLQTPLHYAVFEDYIEIVELLLRRKEIKLNAKDVSGETALHKAVEVANRKLSEIGANVNGAKLANAKPGNENERTVEESVDHKLVTNFFQENVSFLARKPLHLTGVKLTNNSKDIALKLNVDEICSVVKVLLSKKEIDMNPKDNIGRTPYYMAVQSGNLEIMKYLDRRSEGH